jgi:hypothetical protein
MGWFNEGRGRWVRWYPGADAPPLPPRWATGPFPLPPPRVARPRWRSPYRIVPIVMAVIIVGLGVWQATRTTSNPVQAETRSAEALKGKCLATNGTSGGHPRYSPSPVSCAGADAAIRVVSVLPGTPGSPSCPAGTTPVQLATIGVRYPHVECAHPVTPAK